MTTYKEAGVDIEAADKAIENIKGLVKKTFNSNVLTNLGSFGACYKFPKNDYESPILVSSADGVGTKLNIAFLSKNHKTIGQCLINHCVNDILVMGAKPLFFLDYYATGKLENDVFEEVVSGLSKACVENSCALIGGETAEMPGFYGEDEYDLCGTIIGVVDEKNLLSKRKVNSEDILIGLPSTGLHTNGYSLARKVLLDKYGIDEFIPSINSTLSESLLAVHKSYLPIMDEILTESWLVGISHVTGGGLIGNTKRIIDKNQSLDIDWSKWEWPSIFKLIQDSGSVPTDDMQNSFNLGIGMVMIVKESYIEDAKKYLQSKNQEYYVIGKVV
ncbi:MAG: phosphoribosylformylglycinamidine cyclo-ligase [Candidatus Marinimicrobia bacterium]|nr:phosphoribosylformylglycinamidine cyclo-ligase [Candidatus Neomarinimicrobiota bacterium]|tara:strand:+ start:1955 stop:2947 length:993 start_codon:yes stop_codon:yes gene_type:complete